MQLPEDPTREQLREYYEDSDSGAGRPPTDCYANYGDVNPVWHGGLWLTYSESGGYWTVYGTFPAIEMGFDIGSDLPEEEQYRHQFVYSTEVHWSDVVTEDGAFTDDARHTAEALSTATDRPVGHIVADRWDWFIAALADEHREGYPTHDPVHHGEYAEILESLGIEPCDDDISDFEV